MTDTPRQRRTAASILEGIDRQLVTARLELAKAHSVARTLEVRVNTLASVLADAEKNGPDDD